MILTAHFFPIFGCKFRASCSEMKVKNIRSLSSQSECAFSVLYCFSVCCLIFVVIVGLHDMSTDTVGILLT